MLRTVVVLLLFVLAGCPESPSHSDAGIDAGPDAGADAGPYDAGWFDAGPEVEPEALCRLSPSGTLSELVLSRVEVWELDSQCSGGTIDLWYSVDGAEVLSIHIAASRPGGTGVIDASLGCGATTYNGASVPTSSSSCTFSGTVVNPAGSATFEIDGTVEATGTCAIDASVDTSTSFHGVCL